METNVNWDLWNCRSSASGLLMVQPKLKEEKERNELSATAKTYLTKEYAFAKFGKEHLDLKTKPVLNGKAVEEDSITLISRLDKTLYNKNDKRLFNSHFSGEPDIFLGDSIENATYIIDVKSSYSIHTFLDNLNGKLNPLYYYQLQAYMYLTNCQKSEVSYCLVNMDETLLNDERRKLIYSLGVISEDSPEYKEAEKKLTNTYTYDDIPLELKRLRFFVERDDEVVEQMKAKVEKAREYLKLLEKKHLNFNNISPIEPKEKKINSLLNKIKNGTN